MKSPRRMAYIVTHPIQYQLPIYRELAKSEDIHEEVLFMEKGGGSSAFFDREFGRTISWGFSLVEGYRHRIFRSFSVGKASSFLRHVSPGLVWRVLTGRDETVYLHGIHGLTHVLAAIAARLRGRQVVLRTETYDLQKPDGLKGVLRSLAYRVLFSLPHKMIYLGRYNYECFRAHGVRRDKLIHAPYFVDNGFFHAKAKDAQGRLGEIRDRFGIGRDRKVMVFTGKLIPKKQPDMLVQAFLEADLGPDWVLLMVGSGDLSERVAELATGAEDRVKLPGFLDQNAICDAYAIAEMIVLPSRFQETWGLSVNEALNFGCAAIVSDQVGCGPELVADKTGIVFPFRDRAALVEAIRTLANDDDYRARMQANAREVAAECSIERFMAALRMAMGLDDPYPEARWVTPTEAGDAPQHSGAGTAGAAGSRIA